jgi:hypothetical protein
MTPAQLAERLDTSVTALKRQRCAGGGPKFIRHGRGVLYHTTSVPEWEEPAPQHFRRVTFGCWPAPLAPTGTVS